MYCFVFLKVPKNASGYRVPAGRRILAVGVGMLMIAGQFDLSGGSVYGLASGIALLILNAGVPAPIVLVATIESGEAIAAIDQLMYMQGYLPAVLARNYLDWGMLPSQDILTGPAVIDKSNIDKVKNRVLNAGLM